MFDEPADKAHSGRPEIALSSLLEGLEVEAIFGSLKRLVRHPAPLEAADQDSFSFCSKTGEGAAILLSSTRAAVVLCRSSPALASLSGPRTLVVVRDPRLSFLRIIARFFQPPTQARIHPTAVIEPTSTIHPSASIGPFVYVGERCSIGEGSVLHGHNHLYPGTIIGRNVNIHAGTVIGADGFGYQRNEMGELEKFPHLGGVVIEDGVEIGSNTSIDRGTLGNTVVRAGARIDNLVHVAHNVTIGRHAAVIANAMIGGSTSVGDGAWIAPSATLRDGLRVGEHSTVGLGAVVLKDVPDHATVMGSPARPADEFKSMLASISRLKDQKHES